MEVYCRGIARIRHKDTGVIYDVESDELEWDQVGVDERQMVPELHYEAVLDHPQLGELTWGLWEYPIGIENHHDTDAGGHEVVEDFDYGLEHDEPEPDEWGEYDVPSNPFSIFMDSYRQTSLLLVDHGKDDGRDLVNRLVFSHQVTALEAYLGDTLINTVAGDADAMQRLISGDEELSREKFTLAEIRNDPDLVGRRVREHLRAILYHNLAKVDVLYNIALGIRILNLTSNKDALFKAVKLRHDCVHRNGFDKDGNELVVFTKMFVSETADVIRSFVESIENAVRALEAM
ncbi:hypothetical protein [Zavarzinia aquatilis]|uniref:RiboL-PSP-HEPN domain-containing protein n=1 Tax=Zavarzinia aquatilis TaxID=2211142 RepID=A0A317E4V6_9PROT|nr:hypothetical protein [Zavarzinia aquatilis]PWR21206.1 hypothetical protein DKG74_14465 [Zavarzinia aquatilis]